ncbi:hypothetical protein ACPPVU_21220 [Mucilaginibacter sp. McL0603]|uniref:hypothetical protein n=1 Tax=Mucilaginibacter sp. McL0603 TaxID=3415670 RepID=UPI003CF44897
MCLESIDWGNVAEWAAAAAAGITGYLIYQTLRETRKLTVEQQTVTEEQRKITYLQQLKFIYDIRPEFELVKSGVFNEFNLILKENVAVDLETVNVGDGYDNAFNSIDKIEYPTIRRPIPILKEDVFNVLQQKEIDIHVFYQDELGYKYWQWIHGGHPDLVIDPPIMIDVNDDPIKMKPPELKQFE